MLAETGMVDTFRHLHPSESQYSFWSYRSNGRASNSGWRLDYFLVTSDGLGRVESSEIRDSVLGSDHCPVEMSLII